jgi:hypothetical protein
MALDSASVRATGMFSEHLAGEELELAAAMRRELHYAFYVFNVAGDL